jgi:hypothetical protein
MAPFARDFGYDGPPFVWDEERRALLRAELDAWYARAYGLTRDELRYILDPADVKGLDYPSETFRVASSGTTKSAASASTAPPASSCRPGTACIRASSPHDRGRHIFLGR